MLISRPMMYLTKTLLFSSWILLGDASFKITFESTTGAEVDIDFSDVATHASFDRNFSLASVTGSVMEPIYQRGVVPP